MVEREHHDGCEAEGLYRKYRIQRSDGSDQPGGRHDGCRYFVLDLTHDPMAQFAALDYARQCEIRRPNLAADLRRLVKSIRGF